MNRNNNYKRLAIDALRVLHSSLYITTHSLANTRTHTINRVSKFIRDNQNLTSTVSHHHINNLITNLVNVAGNAISSGVNQFARNASSSPQTQYDTVQHNNQYNKHNSINIDIEDDNGMHAPSATHHKQHIIHSTSITHSADDSYNIPISSDLATATKSNIHSLNQSKNRLVNTGNVAYQAAKTAVQSEVSHGHAQHKQPDLITNVKDTVQSQSLQQTQSHSNKQSMQQPATSNVHQAAAVYRPSTSVQQSRSVPATLNVPGAQQTNIAQASDIKSTSSFPSANTSASITPPRWQPRETAVPSSAFGRVWGFGKLAAGMAFGSVTDKLTGHTSNNTTSSNTTLHSELNPSGSTHSSSSGLSSILSEGNAERLAEGLCRMRGAALKVGQILSIQDESVLPPQLQAIFDRVRDRADVMPQKQLHHALSSELGNEWRGKVAEFDTQPIAAASIGQVHRATLHSGVDVVMKVQYPGVADSINSDINNVKRMVTWLNIVPKGLYLEETMSAAKEELGLECDYEFEARCQKKYQQLMSPYPQFYVPYVVDELSTKRVLTSELVHGVSIDKLAVGATHQQPQQRRDEIAFNLIDLCITELFKFRFMQTDPNWSNFLYNPDTNIINLIDFGACRTYNKLFVDEYMRMVHSCATQNRAECVESSTRMGFLTGDESKIMLDAHVAAGFIIGEPFASKVPYNFVAANIPQRVAKLASVMLQHRLTAPPKEAYTLHRKLSGAFLTARKLSANISCHDTFFELYDNYQFSKERYDSRKSKQTNVAQAVV